MWKYIFFSTFLFCTSSIIHCTTPIRNSFIDSTNREKRQTQVAPSTSTEQASKPDSKKFRFPQKKSYVNRIKDYLSSILSIVIGVCFIIAPEVINYVISSRRENNFDDINRLDRWIRNRQHIRQSFEDQYQYQEKTNKLKNELAPLSYEQVVQKKEEYIKDKFYKNIKEVEVKEKKNNTSNLPKPTSEQSNTDETASDETLKVQLICAYPKHRDRAQQEIPTDYKDFTECPVCMEAKDLYLFDTCKHLMCSECAYMNIIRHRRDTCVQCNKENKDKNIKELLTMLHVYNEVEAKKHKSGPCVSYSLFTQKIWIGKDLLWFEDATFKAYPENEEERRCYHAIEEANNDNQEHPTCSSQEKHTFLLCRCEKNPLCITCWQDMSEKSTSKEVECPRCTQKVKKETISFASTCLLNESTEPFIASVQKKLKRRSKFKSNSNLGRVLGYHENIDLYIKERR